MNNGKFKIGDSVKVKKGVKSSNYYKFKDGIKSIVINGTPRKSYWGKEMVNVLIINANDRRDNVEIYTASIEKVSVDDFYEIY